MSLSLYHIDQALEALIDPETGELLDYDAFEQLQMDREHKIENMVCWSKSLDAEAKARMPNGASVWGLPSASPSSLPTAAKSMPRIEPMEKGRNLPLPCH